MQQQPQQQQQHAGFPSRDIVFQMVNLLQDITSTDNNRQQQILNEFSLLRTRPDYPLYLVYLTTGRCSTDPNIQIPISTHARMTACSTLGRVFRDKDSPSRDLLSQDDASLIRNELIDLLSTPPPTTINLQDPNLSIVTPTIKRCIIDVLAYLCIFQEMKDWEQVFMRIYQWMSHADSHWIITGFETMQQMLSEITAYDHLTDNFADVSWSAFFNVLFPFVIQNLGSSITVVRQMSVQILSDCCPSKPSSIFGNSQLLLTMISNLYQLAVLDSTPKTKQLVLDLFSSLAHLQINYVIGFNPSTLTLDQIQSHALNPIPQLQPNPQNQLSLPPQLTLDFDRNIFCLIDHLVLLAISHITRSHHIQCTGTCDSILDRCAAEAISFILAIAGTVMESKSFDSPQLIAFRTTVIKRHLNVLLPCLFNCCKYSGCDLIDIEANRAHARRTNQVAPHFQSGQNSNYNGDMSGPQTNNDDDNNYDEEDDYNDEEEDDDETPQTTSILRRSATSAVTACLLICRNECLTLFLEQVPQLLGATSTNPNQQPGTFDPYVVINHECGLLLLGIFGLHCSNELGNHMASFIPQLLSALAEPNQHPVIQTIIAWTIGRLHSVFIRCDTLITGQSIIRTFFNQALQILSTTDDYNQEYALLHAIMSYSNSDQVYTYFLEFYQPFMLCCIKALTQSNQKQTLLSYTDFFSNLLMLYGQDHFENDDFFLQQIATPFLQRILTIDYADEVLSDWLLALHQLIFALPIDFLRLAALPIYHRALEILSQITPIILTAMNPTTTTEQHDDQIEWQLVNTIAASLDCLNTLIERLGTSFIEFANQQVPQTLQLPLQNSYLYIAHTLFPTLSQQEQQQLMLPICQYQSLPLLLQCLIIPLSYNDITTRQGALAVIGELIDKLPSLEQILKPFFYWCTQIIVKCITAEPSESDLTSNAGWVLRLLVQRYKDEIFTYNIMGTNNKIIHPAVLSLSKVLYISLTDLIEIRQSQNVAILVLQTIALYCPTFLLNHLLDSVDRDLSKVVPILSKLFQLCYSSIGNINIQWEILSGFSTLLPLLALPGFEPVITSYIISLSCSIKKCTQQQWSPPPVQTTRIGTNLQSLKSTNQQVFTTAIGQIEQEQIQLFLQVFPLA